MTRRARRGADAGTSLLELVVAFGLFSLVAAAMVGTLSSTLGSVVVLREDAIGKQAAESEIERMRSLPYFKSWTTVAKSVDLLDLYFPDLSPASADGPGYLSSTKQYRVVKTSTLAPDVTLTILSTFVTNSGATVTPPTTYDHDSSTNDRPPSNLVAVDMTATWMSGRLQRQFVVHTTMGQRRFTSVGGNATAYVNAFESSTVLMNGTVPNNLTLRAGESSSSVFMGDTTTASSSGFASKAEIADPTATQCSSDGGSASSAAPPDNAPATTFGSAGYMGFPCTMMTRLAELHSAGTLWNLFAWLPSPSNMPASGNEVRLSQSGGLTGIFGDVVYDPVRLLSAYSPSVALDSYSLGSSYPSVVTAASSTSGTSHSFAANASASNIVRLQLMPTDFAPQGVVQVELSAASVSCTATGTSSSAATASFGGVLRYWDNAVGGYSTVTISSSGGASPLAALDPASIVVRQSGGTNYYLSDYVASWTSATGATTSVSTDKKSASADVNAIVTVQTRGLHDLDDANPNNPYAQSYVTLRVGKLNCAARDMR